MKPAKKYYVFAAGLILFSALLAFFNTAQPVIVEQFINHLNASKETLAFWLIMYFVSFAAILLIELCRKLLEARYSASLKDWLRRKVSDGVLGLGAEAFTERAPQEYISVMNNDVPVVVEDYYLKITNIIFQLLSILFSCTVLTRIYFPLAIVSAATSILIAVIPFLFKTRLQTRREKSLDSIGAFNVKFSDVVFGHSEIRIQQIGTAIRRIVSLASEDSAKKEFDYERTQSYSEIVIGCVSFLGTFLIIALGGIQVYLGNLDVGSMFAAYQLSDQLVGPVLGISTALNTVVASSRIREKLAGFVETKEVPQEETLPAQPGINGKELQTIEISDLTLKRGERYIFRNYSCKFEKNRKYLVVGQNGSGKSTLMHLIAGDFAGKNAEISGQIKINGVDRKLVPDREFFGEVTILSQVPYLFSGTAEENLTLFGTLDMKEMKTLSALSNDTLQKLFDGRREISNESNEISNGEREKIALLRALMKHSKWLILDEATAALDKKSKKDFEEYLLGREDLTVIHISHTCGEEDMDRYDEVLRIGE